jgi:hypothetical protein
VTLQYAPVNSAPIGCHDPGKWGILLLSACVLRLSDIGEILSDVHIYHLRGHSS